MKFAFQRATAVDDARQTVGQHVQERRHAGQQEDGRDRELNDVDDIGDDRELLHLVVDRIRREAAMSDQSRIVPEQTRTDAPPTRTAVIAPPTLSHDTCRRLGRPIS